MELDVYMGVIADMICHMFQYYIQKLHDQNCRNLWYHYTEGMSLIYILPKIMLAYLLNIFSFATDTNMDNIANMICQFYQYFIYKKKIFISDIYVRITQKLCI